MPRTTRAERRELIGEKLLAATDRLIASGHDYAGVSIERLASEAGVSRATFYIYFESKADLLGHGFVAAVRDLRPAARAWLALGADCAEADMADAIGQIFVAYRRHARLIAAASDAAAQDAVLREALAGGLQGATDALVEAIERGQRDGWIDVGLLPRETAEWAVWLLERTLGLSVARAADADVGSRARTLAGMAWHTLRAPP